METTLAGWLARLQQQHPQQIELGLERVASVAARMALARPGGQVITVAGTNGKGSCVAFVEAIARALGKRVAVYTSPHLLRYNERARIDGVEVDDADWMAAFAAVEAARADTPLTYFEAGTLAALWLFARAAPDLAVLEVGLGGRLDAVNIVDADCAIITTVDLDHQQWLGEDVEAIGFEKAGIARAWKPLILGDDDPPASVLRHAYAIGASSWRIANDFFAEPLEDGCWRYREVGWEAILPRPALVAPVQLRNAACAIAALRALDFVLAPEAIATALRTVQLPARMQALNLDGVELRVDVGHNRQAARALADTLATLEKKRTWAVYAALADKEVAAVAEALAGQVDGWFLAGSEGAGVRGMSVEALAQRLPPGLPVLGRHADVPGAIAAARALADADTRLLVFGSFHAAECGLKAGQ